MQNRIRDLFEELRNRSVIRALIAYAVVAWMLLQVAECIGTGDRELFQALDIGVGNALCGEEFEQRLPLKAMFGQQCLVCRFRGHVWLLMQMRTVIIRV